MISPLFLNQLKKYPLCFRRDLNNVWQCSFCPHNKFQKLFFPFQFLFYFCGMKQSSVPILRSKDKQWPSHRVTWCKELMVSCCNSRVWCHQGDLIIQKTSGFHNWHLAGRKLSCNVLQHILHTNFFPDVFNQSLFSKQKTEAQPS